MIETRLNQMLCIWMAYRRDEISMLSAESIVKVLHLQNTGETTNQQLIYKGRR